VCKYKENKGFYRFLSLISGAFLPIFFDANIDANVDANIDANIDANVDANVDANIHANIHGFRRKFAECSRRPTS
jgi:hypothetical protein